MPDSLTVYAATPDPRSLNAPDGFTAEQGINTVLIDSIGGDTVAGRVPHFVTVAEADSLRSEEIAANFPEIPLHGTPSGAHEGMSPSALALSALHSTPLNALMMGAVAFACLNAPSVARALKSYRSELWSVRRRGNMFDDAEGVRVPTAILLGLFFVIFGGIVLYNCPAVPAVPSFAGATASMALVGCYYIFQLCCYRLVGYTFASPEESRRWIAGFNATQAYSGLFMCLPAILTVCCPWWHEILLIVSLIVYEGFHLVFVLKGFRIFYHGIGSLLYFILYLCTLEIIPQISLYRLSVLLTDMI